MLGAVILLCGAVCLFLRWLINTYDEEDSSSSENTTIENSSNSSRRRQRSKKGLQKRKKPNKSGGEQHASAADSSGGKETPDGKRDWSVQRQSPRNTGDAGKLLDAQDWPTLGASPEERKEEEQAEEEDLAALHAKMLEAARRSTAGDGGESGVAEKEALAARGRNSGRIGVGDRVEGRFEAGPEWFPAIVTKTLHGGLVNLLYDDGEAEKKVPLSLVRLPGTAVDGPPDSFMGADGSETEEDHAPPVARKQQNLSAGGWEVMMQKPKKTRVERIESREEASNNLKNRLKRQKKREKEVAAREALRKKL